MQIHGNLDFTFDIVVLTMSLKILSGLLNSVRCRSLTLVRDIGCRCISWCDLAILETCFTYIYGLLQLIIICTFT